MEEAVGYLILIAVVAFLIAAAVAATIGIGLFLCAIWAAAGVLKGAYLAAVNFVAVLREAQSKVPVIVSSTSPAPGKPAAKASVKAGGKAAQPASKIYAYDRGWRVIIYVREHLFQRTSLAAKDWLKQAGSWGTKARLSSGWVEKYWLTCIAVGCWLAGAAQYISAMTVVVIFIVIQSITLALWAALASIPIALLWFGNLAYARIYRIFVRCPACFTTVPVATYICPQCGVEHSRLWPSVYGVLHHKCSCQKARLATLDRLGRRKYRPICPHCKTPLPGIGTGTNVHVPVVGGPYAGKTNFIVTATRELIDSYGRTRGYDIAFVNQTHANEYEERLRQLSSGQVLMKTADLRPQAYNLRIKKKGSRSVPKLTYVYDPAGEVFGNIAHTTEQGYYEYIDGIVFILDPFAIPTYRARHQAEVAQYQSSIRPSDMDVEIVYSRFIEALESLKNSRGVGVGMSNGQPLAVVVTKVDACGLEQEIGSPAAQLIMAKDPSIGVEQDAISLLVRQFLISNDLGNFVRAAESQFHNVKYFSCSALGRMPGPHLGAGFTSIRVADPLVWLLGNARAVNTRSERVRLIDAHDRATRRRMGGALPGLRYYYWNSLKAGVR